MKASDKLRVLAGGKQLEILNAVEADRGQYWCVATSIAGEQEIKYDVEILGVWAADLSDSLKPKMEKFHKTYGFISVGILRSVSHTLYLAEPGHCTTFLSRATGQLKTCTFRLVLEGFLCVW